METSVQVKNENMYVWSTKSETINIEAAKTIVQTCFIRYQDLLKTYGDLNEYGEIQYKKTDKQIKGPK